MRCILVLLVAVFALVGGAFEAKADYVEVRQTATIKAEARSDGVVLARPPVGTNLILVESGQTNGYYHVRIPVELGAGAAEGFIYRNKVRGYPGLPVDAGWLSPVPQPPITTNPAVYQGIPINGFPEYPITVLDKGHFVVGYSEDFLNPAWVFYRIGPAVDFRSFPRPGFRIDGDTSSRVRTQDYTHSGYDRGHMAPNFAMGSRFGAEGAKSTFVMSNVCPQYHELNDGQWGDLEEWIAGRKPPNATAENFIRGWADEFGEVWVVVGPLFEDDCDPLEAGIPVPSGFFCIVVDEEEDGEVRALAFIMPHEDRRVGELEGFLVSVDEVEERAGLDFFHLLPDAAENTMEEMAAEELWVLPVAPN